MLFFSLVCSCCSSFSRSLSLSISVSLLWLCLSLFLSFYVSVFFCLFILVFSFVFVSLLGFSLSLSRIVFRCVRVYLCKSLSHSLSLLLPFSVWLYLSQSWLVKAMCGCMHSVQSRMFTFLRLDRLNSLLPLSPVHHCPKNPSASRMRS